MKVALLGTGLMGLPMAQRLIAAQHNLTVYNRTIQKTEHLRSNARIALNPKEAIEGNECIILVLSDYAAIEEVLFSSGVSTFSQQTIIQMGTISQKESMMIKNRVEAMEGNYFECPVLGSKKEASEGALILLVGSTVEQFEYWGTFLKCFGPDPAYVGGVGKAAVMKLALNHLIASHAVGFSLSLGLVEKNSIDVNVFMKILSQSSLHAPMFPKKLANWVNRSYENPNFPVKHLVKDVGLILNEAESCQIRTDVIEQILNLLKESQTKGLGDMDYSSVYELINSDEKN